METLANTFSGHALLSLVEYRVAPESLPSLVDTACERFKNITLPGSPEFQQWCRKAADSFRTLATIPTDQQLLAAGRTAAIRLAALCFAAASLHHEDLPETFQKIAAGTTLLERRAKGLAPVTETILLATA